MAFTVLLTPQAEDDLLRLFDFIIERELARDSGDLAVAGQALDAIRSGLKLLERFPFTCRKAQDSAFLRELVIPMAIRGTSPCLRLRTPAPWSWLPCATSAKTTTTDTDYARMP
jgi:plasmid stabilization system protein ParE